MNMEISARHFDDYVEGRVDIAKLAIACTPSAASFRSLAQPDLSVPHIPSRAQSKIDRSSSISRSDWVGLGLRN